MSLGMLLTVSIFVIVFITFWRLNQSKYKRKYSRVNNAATNKRKHRPTAQLHSSTTNIQLQPPLIPNANSLVDISDEFLNFTLQPFDQHNEKQQQNIAKMSQCCRQPNPLLSSLTKGDLEPKALIELIKSDAEMTAKIINTVNSSLFSLRQPIESIHHAIVFMGVNAVRSIAIQFILQQSLTFEDQAQAEAYQKIWVSSYLASTFVFLLAKHLDKENAAELSTLCLLMSLGDMTMLSYQPSLANIYLGKRSLYERVKETQQAFNTNSSVIGATLAQNWQLPTSIVQGISQNLQPLVSDKLVSELPHEEAQNTLLCYLACRLGDAVAFDGIRDIFKVGDNDAEALNRIDLYYVQSNIEQLGLGTISQLFTDQSFLSKANKLVEQISV